MTFCEGTTNGSGETSASDRSTYRPPDGFSLLEYADWIAGPYSWVNFEDNKNPWSKSKHCTWCNQFGWMPDSGNFLATLLCLRAHKRYAGKGSYLADVILCCRFSASEFILLDGTVTTFGVSYALLMFRQSIIIISIITGNTWRRGVWWCLIPS